MNRTRIIVATLTVVMLLGWLAAGIAWAQRGKGGKPQKWNEVQAGVIPTEYGELVGVTGDRNSTTFVLRNDKNEISLVRLQGTKVLPQVWMIKREY